MKPQKSQVKLTKLGGRSVAQEPVTRPISQTEFCMTSPRSMKRIPTAQQNKTEAGPSLFNAHQLLGQGSFGEVFLVERTTDQKLFAMKVLQKKKVLKQNL